MAASFIWKPSTINSWKNGPVFLAPAETDSSKAPVITANGQSYTGKYVNTNEGRHQWVFPSELVNAQDLQVQYGNTQGTIKSGATSFEGAGVDNWQARQKGTLGMANNFDPNQAGAGFGFYPGYQNFPGAATINYNPIKAAPYKFTDPQKFASTYGQFNREQTQLNFDQAQQMAMKTLDTELQALQNYVPAASALKRSETSVDNIFNQAERTKQVNQALPGVNDDLNAQASRARSYASGNLPDSMQNAALELGFRSQSADNAAAGGFGQSSSVARKASDLMSAEKRFQIGQYGEQLTGQNINAKTALNLAPTQYSNAGQQVNVMPSVSASQLSQANLSELNQNTLINPTNALQTTVSQNQFKSNLLQNTNQFNASNNLQAQQFNANAQNQFAMGKFNYDVGYAGSVNAAAQTDLNTQLALTQQGQAQNQANQTASQAQTANTIGAVGSAIGAVVGAAKAAGVFGSSDNSDSSLPLQNIDTNIDGPYQPFTPQAVNPEIPSELSTPLPETNGGIANPLAAEIQPFAQSTGVSSRLLSVASNPDQMIQSANQVSQNAGISTTPQNGFVQNGTNFKGQAVYMDASLADNQSNLPAVQKVTQLQSFLQPLNVPVPSQALDHVASQASNTSLMTSLDKAQASGDAKGFVNTMQTAFNQPTTNNIKAAASGTIDGLGTAYSAYNLYQNWDRMSGAQKSLAVASVGLQGVKATTGTNLGKTEIPGTRIDGAPPLTVGSALNVAALGYNAYELAANWGDINNAQRIKAGAGTVAQAASVGVQTGLLSGTGAVARALPGVNVAFSAYNLSQGLNAVYKGWGKYTGPEGRKAAAFQSLNLNASGLDPVSSVIAFAGMTIGGGGKSQDQKSRDFFRDDIQERGLVDDDYNLTLADGTKANIGIDGNGGKHDVRNPSSLVGADKPTSIHTYDTDYTNDMDFASGMAGNTLTRLLYGGRNKSIDQVGNQIGNALLGSVGYGKDMTPENFNTVMANARGVYSQAGIKSKEDGFALVSQALKEGRLTRADAIGAQQVFNMMYDKNGYDSASKLMSGRMPGVRGMADAPPRSPTVEIEPTVTKAISTIQPFKYTNINLSKDEIRAKNKSLYSSQSQSMVA